MKNSTAPRGLSALFQPIDLTEGTCWKTILRFSFPIILSYLLQQVYSISDAAIVGQTLSAEEVAGVNDIAPIVNIFLQFAFGVSAGFCVITSCNVGSHNQPGVRRSLATQIVLSSVLTVLDGASAAAVKPDAYVDQRHERQRRGLHGSLYLLRDHLCRHRRAAVL